MLSRIADSMYWLNRYLERSESILRTMHTSYVLSLDKSPYGHNSWEPLLELFTFLDHAHIADLEKKPNDILQHVMLDPKNLNSLKVILNRARENARGMQDHITKEVWEQVNLMYHTINNPKVAKQIKGSEQLPMMENLLKNCLLYTGITDCTMPRGMGWNFMNMGKYLERCLITIEITDNIFKKVDYNLEENMDILFWRNLLFSLSGYEFHLKNYRSNEINHNVAHQVIFNRNFPHSINYSMTRLGKYLEEVVNENDPKGKSALLKQFGRLNSSVEFADFEWIRKNGLSNFLGETRNELINFSKSFSQIFFSYS